MCHEATFRRTFRRIAPRAPKDLGSRAREKQQISIWIFDDDGLRSPRLLPERLKKCNACRLELEEEPLDLFMRLDAHIGRQQALGVPECWVDYRTVDGL
jgi:hypothetical protein